MSRQKKNVKVAVILIDGLADVSCAQLQGCTPLEAAETPFMDCIAAAGVNGQIDPVEPGLACGSDTAHLSIFGYDPRIFYRGRGAFESLGAGLEMEDGDIAFKCNFATMDPVTGIVLQRRCDRNFEAEGPELCKALNGLSLPSFPDYRVRVKYATEHRCGVVVHGPGLSGNVSGTDPLKDNLPLETSFPLDAEPNSVMTARIVNQVSLEIRKVLEAHPINKRRKEEGKALANVILLRGCGIKIAVPKLPDKVCFDVAMAAPTKIIAGLGMQLGAEILSIDRATGDYRTDFSVKAKAIVDNLSARTPYLDCNQKAIYPMGFLHIKAVDDAGHDKDTDLKKKIIGIIDQMVGQLLRRIRDARTAEEDYLLVITGDHTTPTIVGDHTNEPVPITAAFFSDVLALLQDDSSLSSVPLQPLTINSSPHAAETHSFPGVAHTAFYDKVQSFGESHCLRGCLGRFPGSEVMPLLYALAQSRYTTCETQPHLVNRMLD